MAEGKRVHPGCPNASNPYHVCAEYCLRKIDDAGKTPKNKKGLDSYTKNKDGDFKKMAGERKVHPTCNNANNPYHECAQYCFKNADVRTQETRKETGNFGRRKKKGSESLPVSPQPNGSANSHFLVKKKTEERNAFHSASLQSTSEEINSKDSSFDKKLYQPSQGMHITGFMKPDHPEEQSKNSRNFTANGNHAKEEEQRKLHAKPTTPTLLYFLLKEDASGNTRCGSEFKSSSVDFQATNRSEKGDNNSVTSDSDSCVWVGKYHVKSSISSILETILEKHGDIAADCHLESLSLRAYYLECLCFVIQELQSTPLKYLTKSKVKEMLAILKDIESARIDVGWLQDVLNQITEALEVVCQQRVAEITKANCDQEVEKTKDDMRIQQQELVHIEKEFADAKAQIAATKARINELELKSSQTKETLTSLRSKVEEINCKALLDELL